MTPTAHAARTLMGLLFLVGAQLPAASVAAQTGALEPRWSVGYGASWFSYSPFLEQAPGVIESDVALDDGVGMSLFVDRWLNGWIGVHVDGSYHRPDVQIPGQMAAVDVWSAAAGITLRPLASMLDPVVPYVYGGAGLVSYGFGGPDLLVAGGAVRFSSDETEQFMAEVGGGMDILLFETWESSTIGVRAEAARVFPTDGPFRFVDEESPGGQGFWRFTLGLSAAVVPH